ncbi:hypothetical protein ABIA39_000088 [Nocardia sp. GAS34]|uniref:hypothetical protein n=1 Tax=unclassified Nocardia TaxID=2637762 RepID=UPI003D250B38
MSAAQPRRSDPEYISAMEHFESMPPQEICAKAQQIDAAQILQASTVWLESAAAIAGSMPITGNSSDQVMNSAGWEGAAADAARASARSFAAALDEMAEVMAEVGGRLGAVAAAAEAVKLAVAPPGEAGPIGAIARVLEGARVIDAQQVQETLRQEALMAMNMIYKPAYSVAGTGVPALPDPPELPGATTPSTQHANTPAPQQHLPQQQPSTPHQQQPSQSPTPPATPAPSQSTPNTAPPPTTHAPAPQSTAPAPQTPAPAPQAPAPAAPAPAAPESSSPPAPPAPATPAGPPLNDPGGQPGITGPIPNSTATPAPGQSGVTPDH